MEDQDGLNFLLNYIVVYHRKAHTGQNRWRFFPFCVVLANPHIVSLLITSILNIHILKFHCKSLTVTATISKDFNSQCRNEHTQLFYLIIIYLLLLITVSVS